MAGGFLKLEPLAKAVPFSKNIIWIASRHISFLSSQSLTKSWSVLDKIRRDFLWEGNSESHKLLLVKLPKVTLPKHLGGSGIRDLAIHSKCMLMKWHRRFIQEDFGLWKEVIVAKHGNSAQWFTEQSTFPCKTGLWKAINTFWSDFFQTKSFWRREWNRIRFWLDKWTEDYTLKEAFSNIFNIARQPSHSIAPAQGWQLWESEAEPNKKFARSKFEELLSLLKA